MTEYGIIEARKSEDPPIGLIRVPHQNGVLTAAYPAFGPNSLKTNIGRMQQSYSHPVTGERISFRPATTSESVSIAAYKFTELAKPRILDSSRWLQLGRILRTQEGVWINPLDAQGQPITDEQTLKQLLTKDTKVNGIYLLNHDGAFVPYDSFQRGVQEARQFAEGGLARALEHTPERAAKNLEAMARTCPAGVKVYEFEPMKEPTLQVADLISPGYRDSVTLCVGGSWDGDGGCAFGVRQ